MTGIANATTIDGALCLLFRLHDTRRGHVHGLGMGVRRDGCWPASEKSDIAGIGSAARDGNVSQMRPVYGCSRGTAFIWAQG